MYVKKNYLRLLEKMNKICIIGNSHVGSLKRGWDKIRNNYPDKKITFFAHRADGLNGLIPSDGKLIPNNEVLAKAIEFTSGGKKEIDPNEYDIFLIYGAGMSVNYINENFFYSMDVITASLNDFIDQTLSFYLLKSIRLFTNKYIFIGHVPLEAKREKLFSRSPHDYIDKVEFINYNIYRQLNAELVMQPLETIVNGNNTNLNFSKGSKRLGIGDTLDDELHPEADLDHMNDNFGAIWLKEFLGKYIENSNNDDIEEIKQLRESIYI